jgi:hygromycin-B 7''-O-kinase
VFLVDDRYVVKFFGDLFHGVQRFAVEQDCYELLNSLPRFPAPQLLAHGALFPHSTTWRWPYLVSTLIEGTSLGAVPQQVSYENKLALVQTLGPVVRRLHETPLEHARVLRPSWEQFLHFLHERRAACVADQRRWEAMPPHLIEQIDDYLLPIEALVDGRAQPHLIHADLNEDHVLGGLGDGRWRLRGLIDFGDAMVGDWMYELVAFHIGLVHCDKRLLAAFLQAYGVERQPHDFVHRAMSYTLLHEFAVLRQVFEEFPVARDVATLEELASMLWDTERPGLE